jgi:hypothetical protein
MRVDPIVLRAAVLFGVALALVAEPADRLYAQDTDDKDVLAPVDPVQEYEIADYGDNGRRDPFIPLHVEGSRDSLAPRFEELALKGVFLGTAVNSLVVLEDTNYRGWFLRVGDWIANARLIEILPEAAVFEVDEYGFTRREVLLLESAEETS